MPRPLASTLTLVCLLLLLASAGCGSMQASERAKKLDNTLDAYRKALRWGEYDAAAKVLASPDGEKENESAREPPDFDFLRDIHVTSYEILDQTLSEDASEAVVRATIGFYHGGSLRVRNLTDLQHWWYEEDSGRWLLDDELPAFKQAIRDASGE